VPGPVFKPSKDEKGEEIAQAVGWLAFLWVGAFVLLSLPEFGLLLRKSAEGRIRADLATLRQAAGAYRRGHGGAYPPSLDALILRDSPDGKGFPPLWKGWRGFTHPSGTKTIVLPDRRGTDSGRWALIATSTGTPEQAVFIDCTHTDTRGRAWTSY
jgi:hypothetical protein